VGRIGACGLVEKPAATKIICARLQQPLVAGGEYAFRALHRLNPVFGKRCELPAKMPTDVQVWTGRLDASNNSWADTQEILKRTAGKVKLANAGTITTSRPSPKVQHYRRASCLLSSQKQIHRLGLLVGKIAIASSRSVYERRLPGKFSQVWKASSKVNSWAR
jgi:hypothetical protein